MEQHSAAVQALLVEFGVGAELKSLAQADSFTILTFVVDLEKRTGISLPPTELLPSNFESLESILAMIARAAPVVAKVAAR
jgi:hypothetical protein